MSGPGQGHRDRGPDTKAAPSRYSQRALHNARRAFTPVVNVIGDHATYHSDFDAPLNSDIAALAARRENLDTVILSPGAPSYGQLEAPGKVFKNFEERGDAFIRLAKHYFG